MAQTEFELEVVDSNFNAPGGFLEVHVSPRDGGGSRRQMAAGLERAEQAS
jgi:hypothetical protein